MQRTAVGHNCPGGGCRVVKRQRKYSGVENNSILLESHLQSILREERILIAVDELFVS
jgi:hypothetical protein